MYSLLMYVYDLFKHKTAHVTSGTVPSPHNPRRGTQCMPGPVPSASHLLSDRDHVGTITVPRCHEGPWHREVR